MSNALAIATVTRAMAAVIDRAVSPLVSGVDISTSRPETDAQGAKRIHLFLYQVLPDPSQRNNDLPTRASNGDLRQRPTAALNLHYLVTFHGDDKALEPHKMLGAVTRDFHARPVLSRSLIQSVSNGNVNGTNLADAPDQVRITSLALTVEDLSKIWMMFSQIPYALSVAYEARVVLIDADESGALVLPVLYRGQDDHGTQTQIGPFPTLDDYEITLPGAPLQGPRLPSYPSAQLGLQLALRGRNLGGDTVTVRFSHPRLPPVDMVVAPADRTPDEIHVVIPNDGAAQTAWAAGNYLVSVTIVNGASTRTSNEISLPLSPTFTQIAPPSPIAGSGTDLVLTLTCSPQIAAGQRAALLVGSGEAVAAPPAAQTATLAFTLVKAPKVANEFVYLRVDGVDSVAFTQQGPPQKFVLDDSKRITIT
jgi:hypothetical protein